jgi:hypothetical protein
MYSEVKMIKGLLRFARNNGVYFFLISSVHSLKSDA